MLIQTGGGERKRKRPRDCNIGGMDTESLYACSCRGTTRRGNKDRAGQAGLGVSSEQGEADRRVCERVSAEPVLGAREKGWAGI